MLAPSRLRENAFLLHFLIETLQCRFETLVITNNNFGQPLSPPIETTLHAGQQSDVRMPRCVPRIACRV